MYALQVLKNPSGEWKDTDVELSKSEADRLLVKRLASKARTGWDWRVVKDTPPPVRIGTSMSLSTMMNK